MSAPTLWATKTPEEIIADIKAIVPPRSPLRFYAWDDALDDLREADTPEDVCEWLERLTK